MGFDAHKESDLPCAILYKICAFANWRTGWGAAILIPGSQRRFFIQRLVSLMTWEQRWHPLREEWVIVAAHRNNRPWTGESVGGEARDIPGYVPDCYLCPGNDRVSGHQNPAYQGVYVFDNDLPCVGPDAPGKLDVPAGIYQNRPATGIARVVCYTPRHDLTLAELDHASVVALLAAWQEQYRELGDRPEVNHVLMFENKGDVVGVSNPHPHCQIYATNFVFKTIENEAAISGRHWSDHRRVLMQDVIAAEKADGRRILAENDSAIAFIPYFARYAYETFVAPKETHASLAGLSGKELSNLADVLREVLIRFDNLWKMPFPYVMALHQAPTDGRGHDGFHFHIEFHPPLRKPNLLEVPGGTGGRRRQLSFGHLAGGEGRGAAECRLRALLGRAGGWRMSGPRNLKSEAVTEDLASFRELVSNVVRGNVPEAPGLLTQGVSTSVARAPGRLDLMGGIGDYSGSLVLQWPIHEAAWVAVQESAVPGLVVTSIDSVDPSGSRTLRIEGDDLEALLAMDDPAARAWFTRDPASHWGAYVAGTLLMLARECGLRINAGLRVLVRSDVPEGKGVSSSAALEVAAMQALAHQGGMTLSGADLARLCQLVENRIVGAPCGIMDQMTSALGARTTFWPCSASRPRFRASSGCPKDWRSGASTRESGTRSRGATTRRYEQARSWDTESSPIVRVCLPAKGNPAAWSTWKTGVGTVTWRT